MSRQLEALAETKEAARQVAAVKALEFELAGAVEHLGGTFLGVALKYDTFESLLTYKAEFEGKRMVAFVGSDTMMNCVIKAASMAKNNRLRWKKDRYAVSGT